MQNFPSQPHSPTPNPSSTEPSNAPHQTTSPVPSTAALLNAPSSSPHPVSQPSHPPPHSTPTPSSAQPSRPPRTPQPSVFHVPRNSRHIVLDFSRNSRTPESKAKLALLSNDPNQNAIALVGMGGAGKTTILRALGRHADIWQKFPDGVWFIELGHDAKVQRLLDQLAEIVTDAFPDFLPKFTHLAAKDNTHVNMMEKLIDLLAAKRFLLIFDDVWDLDPSVHTLVDTACKGVQEIDGGGICKVLTSTRNEAIGRVPTHDVSIAVSPEDLRRETCTAILCKYAGIESNEVLSWSCANRDALDGIIEVCAGLPLALSVAGCGMQEVFGRRRDVCGPNAIVQYEESLRRSSVQLSGAESGSRHRGLDVAIQSSLECLERGWEGQRMRVGEMFRSFCVVEKQMCLPLGAIEKLWDVEDVLSAVRMFSRHSLVWLEEDEGGLVMGVRLHDLVHDVCVGMAEGREGVRWWHGRLVEGYRAWLRTSGDGGMETVGGGTEAEEEEWWKLKKTESDKYMREHVVRHLLGAGRITEAVQLLTDYRWIEEMNKDEERPAFRKVIGELEMLRKYLEKEDEKTESVRRIVRDLSVVVRAMELCIIPHCMKNREECTYQLFGRLRDVVSESGVAERIVYSIERYGERPWVRCGPGVLESGRSSLRRVLELENEGECICVGTGGKVIVGGRGGEIWVLDGGDGTVKKTPVHRADHRVESVFFDRNTGLMYSCDRTGQVTTWKNEEKWRTMQVERKGLEYIEYIECMQVLPSLEKVVLGTDRGRLFVMDIPSRKVVEAVAAHDKLVSSLAIGGSEHVMVSASHDGTIRVWHTESFEDTGAVFEGHTECVYSVALSADGRLLASASWDHSVRVWDVQSGEQLWKSPDEHHDQVKCVLFSGDGRLLFSADLWKTSVWRVSNDGRHVSLVGTLPEMSRYGVRSVCLGDGSDLYVLTEYEVQVWDVRQFGNTIESVSPFLPHVSKFGISEDGSTMLTFNFRSKLMEIRNVCDVSERVDRVILSVTLPGGHLSPKQLTVSNNRRFVAYSHDESCVVYIVDSRNGNGLHSLPDLEEWALSLASDEQDEASNSSSSGDSSSTTRRNLRRGIERLWFSADGNIISASATKLFDKNQSVVHTKSMSWNVQSGEALDEAQLNCDSTPMSSTETPHLVCNYEFQGWFFNYSSDVTYRQGASSSIIATVEGDVLGAHYIADSSRLHLSTPRGMCYIDLITDNTQLPPRDEPPIPFLSQSHPHQSQNTITDTDADEVYDIFISHAGTDKFTIALPLYNLLVALGFKVFLDRRELRPGEDAPEKMIKAMRTAKIAVVILSPEYAARKWTLKELMCFVERFRAGGEGAVIIIPVFYRLTLDDCRDKNTLFKVVNDSGENVFVVEGFLERMVDEREYELRDVLQVLQSLRGVTGIENEGKVTNGESEEEKAAQTQFVEKIRDAIVEAMGRLKSGRAAGPSSARG